MSWRREVFDRLVDMPLCGYRANAAFAVEPTALAAMALWAAGHKDVAEKALKWLAEIQQKDGSLGVDAATPRPGWPTGWAALAWYAAETKGTGTSPPSAAATRAAGSEPVPFVSAWDAAADRAVNWIFTQYGRPIARNEATPEYFGHDTTLRGWSWVDTTHSWVEPTAINMLALRASGDADHPKYREAVSLLLDRQLSDGGWNYGNTTVLGNVLRPHLQPTGLAVWALRGELDIRRRVERSLTYLATTISEQTPSASLGFALLGLAAYDRVPAGADRFLAAAATRTLRGDGSPYKLALLALAGTRIDEVKK